MTRTKIDREKSEALFFSFKKSTLDKDFRAYRFQPEISL